MANTAYLSFLIEHFLSVLNAYPDALCASRPVVLRGRLLAVFMPSDGSAGIRSCGRCGSWSLVRMERQHHRRGDLR